MYSAEPENMPEYVNFNQSVVIEPEDKVENWLKRIEETMITSLRAITIQSYNEYPVGAIEPRSDWIFGPYPA